MFAGRLLLSRSHFARPWTTTWPRRARGVRSPAPEADVLDRVVYSSALRSGKAARHWRDCKRSARDQKRAEIRCDVEPVSLRYLAAAQDARPAADPADDGPRDAPYGLPYSLVATATTAAAAADSVTVDGRHCARADGDPGDGQVEYYDHELNELMTKNWMSDYECYEERDLPESVNGVPSWTSEYGTPDPSIGVSSVPCGGCGALLHCQNTSIPGYLPSELFAHCGPEDLRTMVCQRCHFMQKYNTALSVQVDPVDYPKLFIWPNIMDCIGTNKPVVVVGNKLDLLPGDFPGWVNHLKNTLVQSLPKEINIKHTAVVSAKTGFGIEELINKLHALWQTKGDVYLIGCTNVGKSTMFNTLLQSDYCKIKAVDLVQRATTSPWPGTTLNLLKFPIMRPSNWRLYLRTQRLQSEKKERILEQQLEADQKQSLRMKINNIPSIIGQIGLTFKNTLNINEKENSDPFNSNLVQINWNRVTSSSLGLDENDAQFKNSKWLLDTPGVVHPDQSINLLTTEELMMTIPSSVITPRTFSLRPRQTLFVGGLGRIDCLKTAAKFVRFTVFSAHTLPITICDMVDADEVYDKLLGTHLFAVPCGSKKRLSKWPGLSCYKEPIRLTGINDKTSCADIVLSSAGWVAVTPFRNDICDVQAWTPESRGIYIRTPPFLRFAVNNRGQRIKYTPAYFLKKN